MLALTDISKNLTTTECLKLIEASKDSSIRTKTTVFPLRANFSARGEYTFAGLPVKEMYIFKVNRGFAIHLLLPEDSYPALIKELGNPSVSLDVQQVESSVPGGCEWKINGLTLHLMKNQALSDGTNYKGFITLTITDLPFDQIVVSGNS